MVEKLMPFLAGMNVHIVVQDAGEGEVRTVIVCKSKKKNAKVPVPIIYRGTPEAVSKKLNSDDLVSDISKRGDFLASSEAFDNQVAKSAKTEPATAKRKPGRPSKKDEAESAAKDKDVALLEKSMADCQKLIDDADKKAAKSKWSAIVSLVKTISAKVTPETRARLKEMQERLKKMPEQTELEID